MIFRAILCLLFVSVVNPIFADDLQTVRDRFVIAICPASDGQKQAFSRAALDVAGSEKPDGTWPDVDYHDQARSAWKTSRHLNNLLLMAKANHSLGSDSLKEKTLLGIEWWLANDPKNPNWWHNEIGVPQLLGEIAMILGPDLPDAQRARVIEIMKRSKWTKWTGQNLVWGTGIQVVRGILENNERTVADAYARMYEEIRVEKPQAEGIMPDASFHQHGAQFYSGGYGLAFANDVGRFVAYSGGTKFAMPRQRAEIYARFMLDGQQWMIRGATFDYSATGREITRRGKSAVPRNWLGGPVSPAGVAYGLGNVVTALATLDLPRREEFQAFADRLADPGGAKPISGNRYFWCSDYMSHQRPDFFVSIRMFSTRLFNTELINDEGRKSHHLADGCTLLYRSGDEYRDIFAAWDWNKIPGTTAEQMDLSLDKGGNHQKGKSDFVGGVSDGNSGLAVQDLIHGKLSAHKFWLAYDDGLIAIGSGINCDSDNPVITSINQCLLNGKVSKADHSVTHDGFTYVIPAPQKFELTAGEQTGRWSDIGTGSDDLVTTNIFNLSLPHGPRSRDAGYIYFVFADGDKSENVTVLSNTPDLQAVLVRNHTLLGVAFWKPGKVDAPNLGTVEVDQPCLLLVQTTDNGRRVSASNPKNAPLKVNVKINGKPIVFELPDGPMAGSTVSRLVKEGA